MSLPNAVKGSTHTGLTITWKHPDTTVHDLTNATITGVIIDKDLNSKAITGTLALSDAANGVFTWAFSAADVVAAGSFTVQFNANYSTDSKDDKTYEEDWIVEDSY